MFFLTVFGQVDSNDGGEPDDVLQDVGRLVFDARWA
jgi:hypothetical protein